jgi:MYXO-CTERM domain-containing protein
VNRLYPNRFPCALNKRKSFLLTGAAVLAASVGLSTASSRAANVVLQDGNSSVTLSTAAVTNWTIGSTSELGQESFWYRIGSSGGQSPISALSPVTSKASDTNGNMLNDVAKFSYGSSSGFEVVVTYSLTGGQTGSQTSDLGETIKVSNSGMSSQTFHLFEYTNFNLGGSTSGQIVTITGGNTATDIGNGLEAQTVVSPKPSEFEASNTAASPDLLSHISSSTKAYTLANVASAASGDGEWGFEWDITLGCGSSYVISIDKNIKGTQVAAVPEPVSGAITLLGLGGFFMGRPRRRGDTA